MLELLQLVALVFIVHFLYTWHHQMSSARAQLPYDRLGASDKAVVGRMYKDACVSLRKTLSRTFRPLRHSVNKQNIIAATCAGLQSLRSSKLKQSRVPSDEQMQTVMHEAITTASQHLSSAMARSGHPVLHFDSMRMTAQPKIARGCHG